MRGNIIFFFFGKQWSFCDGISFLTLIYLQKKRKQYEGHNSYFILFYLFSVFNDPTLLFFFHVLYSF